MLLVVLLTFRNVYVYEIFNKKNALIKHSTMFINPFFPNGPVLYPLTISEGIKIGHWEVDRLTHVGLFY